VDAGTRGANFSRLRKDRGAALRVEYETVRKRRGKGGEYGREARSGGKKGGVGTTYPFDAEALKTFVSGGNERFEEKSRRRAIP